MGQREVPGARTGEEDLEELRTDGGVSSYLSDYGAAGILFAYAGRAAESSYPGE